MSKGWEGGSTRRWRRIRTQILNRDDWKCQLKIEGICKYRADSVHHLYGKARGDDPSGLVASCSPCNQHVGDPVVKDPEPRPTTLF